MSIKLRNTIITIFVITWTILFHYESTRYFYLTPWLKCELPKLKFLFPPAGWIMFFTVDEQFGYAEVLGVKGEQTQVIDPHMIFRTRAIGYDNIHRNVLIEVLSESKKPSFCRYLHFRFPEFDNFLITDVFYPSVVKDRFGRQQRIVYQCR